MSSELALRLEGVGKMYKIFDSRRDSLLDALGINRIFPGTVPYREFWALRGIDLALAPGQRVGVIGRNGAGKSTLLKLLTGNLVPTEGRIERRSEVQALLELGGGLHPEFTGRENIRAALTYQGLSPREIAEVESEIEDFTELELFIDQPFKMYSMGMQGRLSFAIATAIRPEILIIDEVLGSGDAYFFSKSTERMKKLVDGGATVLIVSHALDQIIRFCDETIWLERGEIVERGRTVDVVKAYDRFIKRLEDRRLRAKSRKLQLKEASAGLDAYSDVVVVEFEASKETAAQLDVSRVTLRIGEDDAEELRLGKAQDGDVQQSSFALLADSPWSSPRMEEGRFYRTVAATDGSARSVGSVWFQLWRLDASPDLALEVTYRTPAAAMHFATARVLRNGTELDVLALPPTGGNWSEAMWPVAVQAAAPARVASLAVPTRSPESPESPDPVLAEKETSGANDGISRWPGIGQLRIASVRLSGDNGQEQAVFTPGSTFVVEIRMRAEETGRYRITPAVVVYRADGIRAFAQIGEELEIDIETGEQRALSLAMSPLNLGDGHYLVSVALYRSLSHSEESEFYDLIDRSYEFKVTGSSAFAGIFEHAGRWAVS